MQEKEQRISPIKQRILQFADNLNISKREFYAKIGVSRGTLESKTGITEDVLAKFIATFPDVSIEWLMQGKGRMKVDKEVVDNVATDTTVGMILHRDEQLIRENDMNFTQISDFLGYSSIHYFSSQFKKLSGMTPTEYATSIKALSERPQSQS